MYANQIVGAVLSLRECTAHTDWTPKDVAEVERHRWLNGVFSAMKVFVVYSVGDESLHHKLAITLPSKWLDQSVDKVKDAFIGELHKSPKVTVHDIIVLLHQLGPLAFFCKIWPASACVQVHITRSFRAISSLRMTSCSR